MNEESKIARMQEAQVPALGSSPIEQMMFAAKAGMTPESLDKMMDLQERWEANQAKKAYVKAMAEFKKESVTILKDREVRFKGTQYTHATLGSVVSAIVPALSKHGLSHHWNITQENGIAVECVITHEAGHSESVKMSAPPDSSGSKNFIQQLGSTKTYLERYTLLAITGMTASDMDDDGASYSSQQQADIYPQSRFNEMLPTWRQGVADGKTTGKNLVAQLASRGVNLSDEQRGALLSLDKPIEAAGGDWEREFAEAQDADIQL